MKTVFSCLLLLIVLFVSNIDLKGQNTARFSTSGDEMELLAGIVRIIEQANALPIEFKPQAAEILPRSLPNLQRQAALLNQLPKGTVVEIGAHSNGYYDVFMQDALPLQPTIERAEAVRRELIRLGVNAASLTAKGYGIRKPIDTSKPYAESGKNERVEFLIETMPVIYKTEHIIVAGKGAGAIVLGATRAAIEKVLGTPEEFVDEDVENFRLYEAYYFSKGIQIEYDPKTNIAIGILFLGDTAKTSGFKKYKLFPGETDKGIRWGASPEEVMKAYGEPTQINMRYNPNIDKDYRDIYYPNVSFGFQDNRLVFISNNKMWGNK